MAYFDCRRGERYRPFGPGHTEQLVGECGISEESVFSLPLSPAIAAGSDGGDPVALCDPEGDEGQVWGYYLATCLRFICIDSALRG